MTLGQAERQGDLLDDVEPVLRGDVAGELGVFGVASGAGPVVLGRDVRRRVVRSGPAVRAAAVVATVMVLQRLECLSDREAVHRYAFD
ncbi:MAG: DDE transposase, partial [Betaproteobacteria bacterium]